MDPQAILDGVWTTTGAGVTAAFIGIVFGLLQTYLPFLKTDNTNVRNWTLGVLVAIVVGLATWQLKQQGVQPSIPNGIGLVIAYAALLRLSLSLHSDTVQVATGSRPESVLGPDKPRA